MVNYRVKDLEKLVVDLKEAGVTICDEVETYDDMVNLFIFWMVMDEKSSYGNPLTKYLMIIIMKISNV